MAPNHSSVLLSSECSEKNILV